MFPSLSFTSLAWAIWPLELVYELAPGTGYFSFRVAVLVFRLNNCCGDLRQNSRGNTALHEAAISGAKDVAWAQVVSLQNYPRAPYSDFPSSTLLTQSAYELVIGGKG